MPGAGKWAAARAHFEAAVAEDDTAEARLGLGNALWWLGEFTASLEERERAYVRFWRRGERSQAASVAVWLSISYQAGFGNRAASRGWASRASRLVDDTDGSALPGWILLARACAASSPGAGEPLASSALELGSRRGDADLELCALSQLGWWQVALGRVEEGFAHLDEAVAGSSGSEAVDLFTAVFTSCTMLVAAARCGDVVRAFEWLRATESFIRRQGGPYLFAHCRSAHGAVLLAIGEWEGAEVELRRAIQASAGGTCPPVHAEALGRLAQLRVHQGRVEAASQLLGEPHDETQTEIARGLLRLARGDSEHAASGLARRLHQPSTPLVEAALVLGLLVEAQLAQGDLLQAREAAERLHAIACLTTREVDRARAALALGQVDRAGGDDDKAQRHLTVALDAFCRLGLPLEREQARRELARAMAVDDPKVAIAEATLALAGFDALGARGEADATAAFIRDIGGRARSGPRGPGGLTRRESQVLELLGVGLSNPDIAQRLYIGRKTVEHHVGNVLSKLGLGGRAEVAAYVARTSGASRAQK